MKYVLGSFVLLLLGVLPASAYDLFVTDVAKPYDLVSIESDIEYHQVHLGSLEDYPVMYEVNVLKTSALITSLRQLYRGGQEPIPFTLIIVKQDGRGGGVTEIARFTPKAEDWIRQKDKKIGLTFWNSEEITEELSPGVYRIEVSTPANKGKYLLNFGEQSEKIGYFSSLSRARSIQKHMDFSILRMLSLPSVYYPLGIILLLYIVIKVRKSLKKVNHVD